MKNLKIIYCKHIPFKGYYAITFFNNMIVREEYKDKIGMRIKNHESIHQAQAYDFGIGVFGFFLFYLLYLLEWVFKLPWVLFGYKPYHSVSFEQEAYNREFDYTYLEDRKKFAWAKYIFKMIKKRQLWKF